MDRIHNSRNPLPFSPQALCLSAMICLMIGVPPSGNSQEPGLAELREDFENEIAEVAAVQEQRYIAELKKRELFYVEDGNYAAAIPIRDERIAAEQRVAFAMASANTVGDTAEPDERDTRTMVTLLPSDAERGGNSRPSADTPEIAILTSAGDSLQWELPSLAPGGYEVEIDYSCESSLGATIRVQETFFRVTGKVTKTEASDYTSLALGTLKIRTGDGSLRLVAENASSSPLCIRAVHLLPSTP